MAKDKKRILLISSIVLIGAGLGYWLWRRKKQKDEDAKKATESTDSLAPTTNNETSTPTTQSSSSTKTKSTTKTSSSTSAIGFKSGIPVTGDKLIPKVPLTNAIAYNMNTGKALGRIKSATFAKFSTNKDWFFAKAYIPVGPYQTPTLSAVQLQTKDWMKA